MNNPLISVVLPVHNGQRYLRESVDSVRAQTCRDWELIIVDDASTDNTSAIIHEMSAVDSRIRGVRLDQNRRLPGALNFGFALAQGQYFTWTSDDNVFRPRALEIMTAVLNEHPEVAVVYADRTYIDEAGAPLRIERAEPVERIADHNPVGACFLYRREVHSSIGGFDESLFLAEDYDFWLRASCRYRFHTLEADLYLYREHGGSLTGQRRDEVLRLTDVLLEKRIPELQWMSSSMRARALLSVAERRRRLSDRAGAIRVFKKALKCQPVAVLRDSRTPALIGLVAGYRLARASTWCVAKEQGFSKDGTRT